MSYVIRLNKLEHAALLGVLVDYITQKDSTQEWIGVMHDGTAKVTIEHLMTLVSTANWEKQDL